MGCPTNLPTSISCMGLLRGCWLVGWLMGWFNGLVDGLVGWLVGWLVDKWVGWSVGRSFHVHSLPGAGGAFYVKNVVTQRNGSLETWPKVGPVGERWPEEFRDHSWPVFWCFLGMEHSPFFWGDCNKPWKKDPYKPISIIECHTGFEIQVSLSSSIYLRSSSENIVKTKSVARFFVQKFSIILAFQFLKQYWRCVSAAVGCCFCSLGFFFFSP